MRERYKKSGSMSPNEMALLYNDLYSHLLASMHKALNGLVDAAAAATAGAGPGSNAAAPQQAASAAVPEPAELGRLLGLAEQAEASGDAPRAEALHQRRLLAKNEAQVRPQQGKDRCCRFHSVCVRRIHPTCKPALVSHHVLPSQQPARV